MQMKIGTGFRIWTAIDEVAANGVDIPQTDSGRHFCLAYQLKGLFNTHCGGQHFHIPLSQSKSGWIDEWRYHYCGKYKAPPVQEVNKSGQSQASTLSSQTVSP